MSKDPNLTKNNSPNIVIVPTNSLSEKPPQKLESKPNSKTSTDVTNKSIPILIQGTTLNSESYDMNSYGNMNAKNKSWASNYLQSIGLSYEKSIFNQRVKMNTSQNNSIFPNQDPPPATVGPHQFGDVNLQSVGSNSNYAFGQSSILGNNTTIPYYNNRVSNTRVLPGAPYPGSYETHNYCYDQRNCCSTCYGMVENLPNTYLNTYGQHSYDVNNACYITPYNANATSNMAAVTNLPFTESYSFTNNNTRAICEDNRCPTPLFDENSFIPQLDTCIEASSLVTKLGDIKTRNIDDQSLSSVSKPEIEDKTCNCMCMKRTSDAHDKQNTEKQNNTDKSVEKISSVQAYEKAFRNFLRKLKKDRSSEQKKKRTSPLKSLEYLKKVKKSKSKSKEKSSVQENEKAFRKLLQKLQMESNSKPDTTKSENKQVIRKNTSSTTLSDEKTVNSLETKSSKDNKQKETERPKFIKTKYVDEQEPVYKPIKKARLESNYELEKYSKTKIYTTKYVDEQNPDRTKSKFDDHQIKKYFTTKSTKLSDNQGHEFKPMKKAKNESDYELKKYSNTKTIPTKYIDKQEPVYKPDKKNEKERDCEVKKYLNTKTIFTKYVDDKKHEHKQIKKTRIDSSSESTKYDSTNFTIKRCRDESDTSEKLSKKYDSNYKIKTYKTESTKYYKYKNENSEDTHKETPVKSVVKISKTRELKKLPLNDIVENKEDLRDKLSRKFPTKNKDRKEDLFQRKSSKESNDNLIITVNNNITENEVSPEDITDKLKTKTESCKKINLVINIVYKQPGSRSESDKSDNGGHSPQANADLSFLDDFNVDEIVASLNKTEKISAPQNAQSNDCNVTSSGEEKTKKINDSKFLMKTEDSEISKAEMILERGDTLNNLLSKEASILDSLRTIHKEIQSEKSYMVNEQNKTFRETHDKLPQKDNNICVADALLKRDIKNETVLNPSMNENSSPEKSNNEAENNMSRSINTSQQPLIVLLDHLKKIGHPKDLNEPINYGLVKEESKISTEVEMNSHGDDIKFSNDLNIYDDDITSFDEEDKRRQSELLKTFKDTIDIYDDDITSFDEEDKRKQSELLKTFKDTIDIYDDDITSFDEADKRRQSEHLKTFKDTIDIYDDDITSFDEEDKRKQSELLKTFKDTIDIYDDDITSFDEEDKRRQSELLKTFKDTIEDEEQVTQTQTNTSQTVSDQVSNVLTTIYLSSDDSNDCFQTKGDKNKQEDDVYFVEEKSGESIETIDLTTAENLSNQISIEPSETALTLNNTENKSHSSYSHVKENMVDNQKTNNMGGGRKELLSNEIVQETDVYLDSNKYKDVNTDIAAKSEDTTNSLKTSESLDRDTDKLCEDAIKGFPAMNKMKQTLDILNNVKDSKVSNIQYVINRSQSSTQPRDRSLSASMEDENSASRMSTLDCQCIQETENSASVTNSQKIENCGGGETEINQNEKDHAKFEEDVTTLPRNSNTMQETVFVVENNAIIEETVLQAEVDVKKEKSSSTDDKSKNSAIKISNEECNTIQTTETVDIQKMNEIASCIEQKENDENIKNVVPQIMESNTEIYQDEKKNTIGEGKSPKVKVQNKSEASTPKIMPSTSGTKTNTPLPSIKKGNTNLKVVDVKVENANKKWPTVYKDGQISKISRKIEHEMFKCFNQKYTAQGLISWGSFSKVFHFSSFSGRQYAVKSYNDTQSIYRYAEKKDMMFAMQDGLMRHTSSCVFLINSFSMQGRLCLLMDYYPKNLKQAMQEEEKPFHINVVQKLARQLVSAVRLLKSHDVVHLDIKPTHILLNHTNDRLKLCGFDAARYINKIPMLSNLGTVNYRPPEVIVGYKIGFDVDVWATAAVMYEMAIGIKLFPGTQNNDILFKQMCTLGALPIEMIHRSHFGAVHFSGSSFKRIMPNTQNTINLITKFHTSTRIETTSMKAYKDYWRSTATQQQFLADKEKISSFTTLLREMLEVDPGDRMPIQFVNAHPFITDEC